MRVQATNLPGRFLRGGVVSLPSSGPLSGYISALLASGPGQAAKLDPSGAEARVEALVDKVQDPLADDDFELALYLCYELHYRSFPGVDSAWEWSPVVLAACGVLEQAFFEALESVITRYEVVDPDQIGDLLFALENDDRGVSLSRHLETQGTLAEFREFVVHRSLYQLKEADPHSWAIPRLTGAAKMALLEVQCDEYGGGQAERIHSTLFAKTMRALGLNDEENGYLAYAPGATLASVNLISALGLHRAHRGAIVGHLAMFEMTSPLPNRRYGNALRRLGFGPDARDFYDEHVEADAVHENIAAYDLAGGLARQEPDLASDIIFGAQALLYMENRFARRLVDAWRVGDTSLRQAL